MKKKNKIYSKSEKSKKNFNKMSSINNNSFYKKILNGLKQ